MPDLLGGLLGAAAGIAAAPYLARLADRAPDRDDRRWWRWGPPAHRRATARVGALAAALGALAGAVAGTGAALPGSIGLALVAAVLAIVDIRTHRLPDRLVGPAALCVAAGLSCDPAAAPRAVVAGLVVLVALGALAAPGWLGFGDVKLGAVLGAYLGRFGWAAVVDGLGAGFVLGALVASALVLARRATASSAIPFGPMLVLGALAGPALAA